MELISKFKRNINNHRNKDDVDVESSNAFAHNVQVDSIDDVPVVEGKKKTKRKRQKSKKAVTVVLPTNFDEKGRKYRCCCCHIVTAAKVIVVIELICILILSLFVIVVLAQQPPWLGTSSSLLYGALVMFALVSIGDALLSVGLLRLHRRWFLPYLILKSLQMVCIGIMVLWAVISYFVHRAVLGMYESFLSTDEGKEAADSARKKLVLVLVILLLVFLAMLGVIIFFFVIVLKSCLYIRDKKRYFHALDIAKEIEVNTQADGASDITSSTATNNNRLNGNKTPDSFPPPPYEEFETEENLNNENKELKLLLNKQSVV